MTNGIFKARNKACRDLMKIRRSYDAAAKKLLSNKRVLANILKYLTEEFKDCTIKEIMSCLTYTTEVSKERVDDQIFLGLDNAGSETVSTREGIRSFDVKFKVKLPNSNESAEIIINIEAQNDYRPGYIIEKRGIYYLSRLISSQYGIEFLGSDFNELKKAYTIWICLNVPKEEAGTVTGYRMIQEDIIGNYPDNPKNYDLQRMVIARLGKKKNIKYKEKIMEMLNILFNIGPQDGLGKKEKEILKEKFEIDIEEIKDEVDNMCSLSQGILEEGIEQGMEQGLREGKEAGIKEGREAGIKEGKEAGIKEGIEEGKACAVENILSINGNKLDEALKMIKMDKEIFLKLRPEYKAEPTK